jgi:hypothetical protein
VFFSLSYPAFHTGLSKGNACGVLRLCGAAEPRQGLPFDNPVQAKRSAGYENSKLNRMQYTLPLYSLRTTSGEDNNSHFSARKNREGIFSLFLSLFLKNNPVFSHEKLHPAAEIAFLFLRLHRKKGGRHDTKNTFLFFIALCS